MKKFIKIFLFAFLSFTLIIASGTFIFFGKISKGQQVNTKAPGANDTVNVLILGVDAKNIQNSKGSRTDTIMIASFDPQNKVVHILSIPRDTRVIISGQKGHDKINHAHAYGGVETAINTIESFLNIDINYYIKVDYNGLAKVVDDIGGVEVDVPMNMKYSDPYADPPLKIDLKKGKQILDSDKALQFVRFRKGYSDQDLGRIDAQHTFIRALADKLLGPRTILVLPKLLETFSNYVETNIPPSVITAYSFKAATIKKDNITINTIPGESKLIHSIWYYIPNNRAIKEMVSEMSNSSSNDNAIESQDTPNQGVTVEVLNASGIGGLAAETARKLEELGYIVVNVDNISGVQYNETHIYDRTNKQKDAKKLLKLLGVKRVEQDIKLDSKADITIIVGAGQKDRL